MEETGSISDQTRILVNKYFGFLGISVKQMICYLKMLFLWFKL